jgi:septum formation protein
MRLILASSSPRRRQLLTEAGYDFEVMAPHESAEDVSACGVCSRSGPAQLVLDLALRKAADVVGRLAADVAEGETPWAVVACDTVAECGGEILGKPADRDHAAAMLRRLRGNLHRVYSGLCVWPSPHLPGDGMPLLQGAVSVLSMEAFDDAELERYLDTGLWQGKAGAFGLQDRPDWIRLERGSDSNVVGLPMELLGSLLARLDVTRNAV